MYCVKAKYFMIRNTLNYVWENTINLYGLFEDQAPLTFSIFVLGFGLAFSIYCVLLKYSWICDCDEAVMTIRAFFPVVNVSPSAPELVPKNISFPCLVSHREQILNFPGFVVRHKPRSDFIFKSVT